MSLAVGAIADDFTGALDLANNLVRAGLRVVQLNGVPTDAPAHPEADAIVVALKTRTSPVSHAVEESLAALAWLREASPRTIFFKYCSTFDSTPKGNIGPVIDALLDALGADFTVAAPAFPDTGRTVRDGDLFVAGVPLDESSMRHHPLTPMTDANVVRLLKPQTSRRVGLVPLVDIAQGADAVRSRIAALRSEGVQVAVLDTVTNDHLATLAEAIADLPLVTGSSGLGLTLPQHWGVDRADAGELPAATGAKAVISGSVSAATNEQVARFGGASFAIDPLRLLAGEDVAASALAWARDHLGNDPVLVYSTAPPEQVAAAQAAGDAASVGALVEEALATIAVGLVDAGVGQLIVAGGETSGAVVSALGIAQLRIGRQIDPGVPWAYGEVAVPVAVPAGAGGRGIHIALKSGNFGGPDFFTAAFEELA